MTAVGPAMIIDAVDQSDIPVAQIHRSEVFQRHANFRVSHVFVFNSSGALLIQRLALMRPRHAGYWGSSVAAYLFSHEDYRTAAVRRMAEELGITGAQVHLISKDSMNDEGSIKFVSLFVARYNGPFEFDHEHIDRLEFRSLPQIEAMMRSGVRFTPTFHHVFNSYMLSSRIP
jgi:isopentenyldiphosphate isomerase